MIELDLVAKAASLGAWAVRAKTRDDLVDALSDARGADRTSESWWDVPVAETSKLRSVQTARAAYEQAKRRERYFFPQENEAKVRSESVASRAERKRP